jgi:hypothetical protein
VRDEASPIQTAGEREQAFLAPAHAVGKIGDQEQADWLSHPG